MPLEGRFLACLLESSPSPDYLATADPGIRFALDTEIQVVYYGALPVISDKRGIAGFVNAVGSGVGAMADQGDGAGGCYEVRHADLMGRGDFQEHCFCGRGSILWSLQARRRYNRHLFNEIRQFNNNQFSDVGAWTEANTNGGELTT